MTAANPHVTSPEVVPFPFDWAAWEAWLIDHTDPQWRSDEWNREHWLFIGDPDKESTAIWRYYRAGCQVSARASRHLCRSGRKSPRSRGQLALPRRLVGVGGVVGLG